MNNLTLSIFKNVIFQEIISELKSLKKFQIKFYESIDLCIDDANKENNLVVFFKTKSNEEDCKKLTKNKFPIIIISQSQDTYNINSNDLIEKLNSPFKIIDFEKKATSLFARYKFNLNSFINLNNYIIDRNERKIQKNNLTLKLTEKEINFLILFSKNKRPLSKNFVLKNVWNYSFNVDTHTVETHIHRLRKKILQKFNDNDFIKNNNEGYYI